MWTGRGLPFRKEIRPLTGFVGAKMPKHAVCGTLSAWSGSARGETLVVLSARAV